MGQLSASRSPRSAQTPSQDAAQWSAANQRYLMIALGRVRDCLAQSVRDSQPNAATSMANSVAESPVSPGVAALPPSTLTPSSALEQLEQRLSLSAFERDLLLLCAGMELSDAFGQLCGEAQGLPERSAPPTLGLALAKLPQANWQAITPQAPLRYWHLLELGGSNTLMQSPLRLDERILHYLMGIQQTDERLRGLLRPWVGPDIALPNSYQAIATQMVSLFQAETDSAEAEDNTTAVPIIQLCGEESLTQRAIAQTAAQTHGLGLLVLSTEALPTDPGQLHLIQRLCEREALLTQSLILIDCHLVATTRTDGNAATAPLQTLLNQFLDTFQGPIVVASRDRRSQHQRPLVTFEISLPTPPEQRQLWRRGLNRLSNALANSSTNGNSAHVDLASGNIASTTESFEGAIETLVSHFTLSPPAIQTICLRVNNQYSSRAASDIAIAEALLWQTTLSQARPRLDALAQSIQSSMSWENLVLPNTEFAVLKTIAAHVRQRTKVYEQWGFGGKNGRGLGISALFAGPSGTGKTLAAEVLANELNLDLYRIDLSTVVSKYIGETEKNLRRIFDAAEAGGAILLFDEADALFGKRSEVKDSHDRYANMEVAYLLQRIESYRGLAILTTNLKGSVDQAFLRRIRFIVQFPFPDSKQREEIWQRIFPKLAPLQDLSYKKLAKLSVAGGNIRNIALNAAFLAADADEAVGMSHLLQAARAEYLKLERPLTDAEIRGWASEKL